jgi:hypothetical protein
VTRPTVQAVGVDLKALRTGDLDPLLVLDALGRGARAASVRPVAWMEDSVPPARATGIVRHAAAAGVDLRVEPRPDDAGLTNRVGSVDVVVLPYRTGSHSGLLELCRDVGVRPVAPATGCYRDQWDQVVEFRVDGDVEASLSTAVARAARLGPVVPDRQGWRVGQLAAIRAAHLDAYRNAVTVVRT